jgi:iron complex transport system substrate-binding protein
MRFIFAKFITVFLFLFLSINFLYCERIVSLLPSYTEILFELGAGNDVVGVTNFCNYPPEAVKKAKVGDYLNPDIEMIYKLKPDIIFMGNWNNKIIEKFKKKNIKIVVLNSEKNIKDIYDTIKTIAKYIKKENEAEKLIKKMKDEISSFNIKKKYRKVYIELDKDYWTCGNQSFISDVISQSGGINIFNDLNKDYFKTNWEEIIKRNPDIVILLSESIDNFLKRPASKQINAVKNGKVYFFTDQDRDLISRPTPRVVKIIEKLSKIINE